jgi:MFS family permease
LFRNSAFAVGLLTTLAFCCGLSAFFLTVTLFLQSGLGLSPTVASMAFAPFAVGYLTASALALRLGRRLGGGVILVGSAVMAAALVGVIVLVQVRGRDLTVLELMPVLLIYGIGQGLTFPTLIATALSRVPAVDAGSASGVLATVQQVAFSLGVAVIGSVFFAVLGSNGSPAAYAGALGAALICNIVLLALTFALAFRLPRFAPGEGHAAPVAEM